MKRSLSTMLADIICQRGSVLLIGFGCLCFMVGCNRSDRPPLGVVTGKVYLDGEPLKNVEIAFIPEVGRPSYGETDNEGRYDLIYIREIRGAKVGSHKVHIRSGKVDNDKLDEVYVKTGKNVIDIQCQRKTKTDAAKEVQTDGEV